MEGNPKVLFLVGAGAIENAWAPVLRAVRTTMWTGTPLDSDLANLQMARLVYLLRAMPAEKKEARTQLMDALRNLRAAIVSELVAATATAEIRVRPALEPLLRRFGPGADGYTGIITTNWDHTIDEVARGWRPDVEVLHLHGDIADTHSLYLPTEMSLEWYRTEPERQLHAALTVQAIGTFEEATHLIVYGLSLSPLDAELAQLISYAKERKNLRRAHVVDPNGRAVARRLAVLLEHVWPAEGIHYEQPNEGSEELSRDDFSAADATPAGLT